MFGVHSVLIPAITHTGRTESHCNERMSGAPGQGWNGTLTGRSNFTLNFSITADPPVTITQGLFTPIYRLTGTATFHNVFKTSL